MIPVTYRVMTVCTGNICRSPMAEIVLRDRFGSAGLDVVVDSTGVSDEEHGNPIDRRARTALAARGYPTGDGHIARQATGIAVDSRDLVLAMTNQHARRLRALRPGADVRLYRSFDPAAAGLATHLLDIADPWYGGPDDFEECLDQIEAAADGVVAHVRTGLGG
ncbi:low molecular weight protein-tyrosine-phosphatase [Myceligenerans xiligouense]|uniref:protein-tyrosine-phosphatase n=1 Tax=Myceligenerans xiligouense TaxID=253184 RepID=A0A3N4YKL1_9MICO|nr:low molecular weight protein-tyrosine-phosphatase [Myceligenerans xiligouense]RPF21639.1 protein-tyrosine phosphatase [Myceligenerans xiligouense]